jgi:metal-responsive CopG/Arc/MetJ family transcriptional regulator
LTGKSTSGYGKTITVAISLPASIVEEVEKHRRFDSRSRYILRAVDRYLREEEEQAEQEDERIPQGAPSKVSSPERRLVVKSLLSFVNNTISNPVETRRLKYCDAS